MITVGKYTYGQGNIKLHYSEAGDLVVGKFCSIAENCNIYLDGNHRIDWITTYPFGHINKDVFDKFDGVGHPQSGKSVTIGNDVWIGSNVTIMGGLTIGDGAVLALNSHVVKDVEPYSIVGGNPAEWIDYRFDRDFIDWLLDLKWWDLPDEQINELSPLLCSGSLDGLVEAASRIKARGGK